MSICNIYEQQTVHIHYHSLNDCGILLVSSKLTSTVPENGEWEERSGTLNFIKLLVAYVSRNYSMYSLSLC